MKKTMMIMAAILAVVNLSAQRTYLPTPEDLNHLKSTKTYVVLQDNPMSDYNFDIQDGVKKYWTLTEYEFLDFKEFREKSKDPNASFLYEAKVNFEKDKSEARYMFLCLSLGGADVESLDNLKDITSIPLAYSDVDEDQYTYKLGTLLRFMQNHVNKLIADPALVSHNVLQMYNENMSELAGKTLYLVEDEIDPKISSDAQIREIYSYPYKIVDRDDVRELILSANEDAVILHKVGPGKDASSRVYKALIGANDARFYYYNYHKASPKNPDAFLRNDFRRINKAPKK